jgi:hypothetical protein
MSNVVTTLLPNKKILVDVGNKVIERTPINKLVGTSSRVLVKYNRREYPIEVLQINAKGTPVLYGLIGR